MEELRQELIRVKDAALMLGVSESTVLELVKKGILPPLRKLGPRISTFVRADIERVINDGSYVEAEQEEEGTITIQIDVSAKTSEVVNARICANNDEEETIARRELENMLSGKKEGPSIMERLFGRRKAA